MISSIVVEVLVGLCWPGFPHHISSISFPLSKAARHGTCCGVAEESEMGMRSQHYDLVQNMTFFLVHMSDESDNDDVRKMDNAVSKAAEGDRNMC